MVLYLAERAQQHQHPAAEFFITFVLSYPLLLAHLLSAFVVHIEHLHWVETHL